MTDESHRESIRALIRSAGSTIFSIHFRKKDGTPRTLQGQLAAGNNRVLGEAASPSAQAAVATRRANHPELFPVWDISLGEWRNVNLDTVEWVQVRGVRHEIAKG